MNAQMYILKLCQIYLNTIIFFHLFKVLFSHYSFCWGLKALNIHMLNNSLENLFSTWTVTGTFSTLSKSLCKPFISLNAKGSREAYKKSFRSICALMLRTLFSPLHIHPFLCRWNAGDICFTEWMSIELHASWVSSWREAVQSSWGCRPLNGAEGLQPGE